MHDLALIKFKEANQKLKEGDINAFGKHLIELYSIINCNCFFRDQKTIKYKNQLKLINNHQDNETNLYINLAKGFIYLTTGDQRVAFKYLSNAISIDSSIDLPYSLRASIDSKINPFFEEDAKKAVLLNPSARNYFCLASVYTNKQDISAINNSIIYLEKAIKLKPDFACAYNNRAAKLRDLKDFQGAIKDYKKCIKIDKSHFAAYYQLWICLDTTKRYKEALNYIKRGSKIHSNKINYQFGLGVANERIGKYASAIRHYQKYLNVNPQNSSAKRNLEICRMKFKKDLLDKAKVKFNNCEYKAAISALNKYTKTGEKLNSEYLHIYLASLLKNQRPDVLLDENNLIFKRLNTSITSHLESEEGFIEEGEYKKTNKLIDYKSNHRIGFGKYEGDFLSFIINKDPEYTLWCIINIDHFLINQSLFLNSKLKNSSNYLLALEHNLIKELIIEKWKLEIEKWRLENGYYDDEGNDDDYHIDYRENERDTFYALTEGQLGDWEDFMGDMDDVMTWLGR